MTLSSLAASGPSSSTLHNDWPEGSPSGGDDAPLWTRFTTTPSKTEGSNSNRRDGDGQEKREGENGGTRGGRKAGGGGGRVEKCFGQKAGGGKKVCGADTGSGDATPPFVVYSVPAVLTPRFCSPSPPGGRA